MLMKLMMMTLMNTLISSRKYMQKRQENLLKILRLSRLLVTKAIRSKENLILKNLINKLHVFLEGEEGEEVGSVVLQNGSGNLFKMVKSKLAIILK